MLFTYNVLRGRLLRYVSSKLVIGVHPHARYSKRTFLICISLLFVLLPHNGFADVELCNHSNEEASVHTAKEVEVTREGRAILIAAPALCADHKNCSSVR